MQTLLQDLRYGARMLMKRPSFTLIAVLTLALGIGASTAIFSVVNAVLLRPLPFRDAERLTTFWLAPLNEAPRDVEWTEGLFAFLRAHNQTFESLAAYDSAGFNLTGKDSAERLEGATVTHDFFRVLQQEPLLGGTFLPQEDTSGNNNVIILSIFFVDLLARLKSAVTNERPLAKLYGRTSDTLLSDFILSNSYHSLQARVDRSFRRLGGRITAAYTFSKSLDYTDAFSIDDDLDINNNRGPSVFDRKHNLVVSHVLRLPFGRGGKLFDSNGLRWQALLSGFALSGVFSARSGTPVDIGNVNLITDPATGRSNRPLGAVARPNVTGTSQILGGLGPGQKFFDATVFNDPSPGQTGNVGRNSLRGPSYRNYNATLSRTFTLTERFNMQFQASAFNVTNTPHFSNPSGDFTLTTFGESRTTFGERSVRFGLKLSF